MPKAFEKLLDIYDRLTLPTGRGSKDPGFGYPVMSREFKYPGFVVPLENSDILGQWRPISPSSMLNERMMFGSEIDYDTAKALEALKEEWKGYKRGTPSIYQWNPDSWSPGGRNTWRHEMVHAVTGGYRGIPQSVVDELAGSGLYPDKPPRQNVAESMAHLSGNPGLDEPFLYKAIIAYENAGQPDVAAELKKLLLEKLDKSRVQLDENFWKHYGTK